MLMPNQGADGTGVICSGSVALCVGVVAVHKIQFATSFSTFLSMLEKQTLSRSSCLVP